MSIRWGCTDITGEADASGLHSEILCLSKVFVIVICRNRLNYTLKIDVMSIYTCVLVVFFLNHVFSPRTETTRWFQLYSTWNKQLHHIYSHSGINFMMCEFYKDLKMEFSLFLTPVNTMGWPHFEVMYGGELLYLKIWCGLLKAQVIVVVCFTVWL